MDISKVTADHIVTASEQTDLDAALAPILDVLDPTREHDLGGVAGDSFSGVPRERWASEPPNARAGRIVGFLRYLRCMED